ncbi:hypothetical protein U1701_13160 [Sphingomonas sp. PB2P19]|uniref:hypothetical protein n=1 Tax=Sphingomonas rhamnosi TaxID=3096156 RepID=UPI002FC76508
MKINAILLKPLDGLAPGSPRQFDKVDFDRLKDLSAVREAGDADALADASDEDAQLLEQLRDPAKGAAIIASMKAAFKDLQSKNEFINDGMTTMRQSLQEAESARDAAITERDAAIVDRDAARKTAEELKSQIAAMPQPGTKSEQAPANKMASAPHNKTAKP